MCGAPPTASITYWRVRRSKNDEFGDLTALRYGGPDSGVVAVDGKLKTMADTIEKDVRFFIIFDKFIEFYLFTVETIVQLLVNLASVIMHARKSLCNRRWSLLEWICC